MRPVVTRVAALPTISVNTTVITSTIGRIAPRSLALSLSVLARLCFDMSGHRQGHGGPGTTSRGMYGDGVRTVGPCLGRTFVLADQPADPGVGPGLAQVEEP